MEKIRLLRKKIVGDWLRKTRERRGLTLLKVGLGMGFSSGQNILNIEKGRAQLPVKRIRKISEIYNIPAEVLIDKLAAQYYEILLAKFENKRS